MRKLARFLLLTTLLLPMPLITACEDDDTVGEQLGEAADDVEEGMEDAGDELD